MAKYTMEGRADKIRCPTLICMAEEDEIAVSAPSLFHALAGCETKRLERFTREEDGAGAHCETGARLVFNQRVFDWLDEVLRIA